MNSTFTPPPAIVHIRQLCFKCTQNKSQRYAMTHEVIIQHAGNSLVIKQGIRLCIHKTFGQIK